MVCDDSMKVLLIGSDTQHRRFIINKILDEGICSLTCMFQKDTLTPDFDVTSPWLKNEQNELVEMFESAVSSDLDRVQSVFYLNRLSDIMTLFAKHVDEADFVIVSGADRISGPLLNAIQAKALNVHMGVASQYRGLDSNLWAWYHHDWENMGVTLHQLDSDLDTGNVFETKHLTLPLDVKIWQLRFYESELAAKLTLEAIRAFQSNELHLKKQVKLGRYYSFMPSVIKKKIKMSMTTGL